MSCFVKKQDRHKPQREFPTPIGRAQGQKTRQRTQQYPNHHLFAGLFVLQLFQLHYHLCIFIPTGSRRLHLRSRRLRLGVFGFGSRPEHAAREMKIALKNVQVLASGNYFVARRHRANHLSAASS